MNRLSISISLATVVLVAYLVLLYWVWASGEPPRWVNPPLAQIQLAFLDGAQRSGGVVGDDDDNGRLDAREGHTVERGSRTDDSGWLDRAWRSFRPKAHNLEDRSFTSAPRSEGYGKSDHGGHERN